MEDQFVHLHVHSEYSLNAQCTGFDDLFSLE